VWRTRWQCKNSEVDAFNHGGGAWLSIVCNHSVDDGAKLLISGVSRIHRASSVATGPAHGGHKPSVVIDGLGSAVDSMDEAKSSMDAATCDGLEPRSGLMGEEDLRWVHGGQARGVSGVGFDSRSGAWGLNRPMVTRWM
jgi:hypothetical protein